MTSWHVAVNGQAQGPFSKEQISEGLSSSQYTKQTMVWATGYEDWKPIEQVHEPNVSTAMPVPPSSQGLQAHEIDYEIFGQ